MKFNRDLRMGWRHARLKYVARIRYGLGQPPAELDGGLPLIRATNVDHGRIVPKGLVFIDPADVPKDRDAVLRCNEIIVVRSGAYTGDSAIVPVDYAGAIAGYDMVVRVTNAVPQYIAFSLLSIPVLRDQIDLCRLRAAQPHLNAEELGDCVFALPSIKEQQAIAEFLDRKTAQIDGVIAKKQRMIDLLHEKRQALISEAVTKGLDPDVPTKHSCIEWLGRVPRHWKLVRAKFLFKQSSLPVRETDGIVTAFRDGQVTLRENRRVDGYTFAVLEQGYQGVRIGQLVVHSMDAFAGAIGISESDGKCSPEYVVCDPLSKDIVPSYYAFLLREMSRQGFIEVSCNAVRERAPRIRFAVLGEMLLPVPPRKEQLAIGELITSQSVFCERYSKKIRLTIAKLREYRQTIISAAVTGQIDVTTEGQR